MKTKTTIPKKTMGQGKEIKKHWIGAVSFDNCFCVIFGCSDQSFISGRETGH